MIRSEFLIFNDPSYGKCFTFNSALNNRDPLGVKRLSVITGPEFGLDLIINVEQSKELIIRDVKIFFSTICVSYLPHSFSFLI